MGNVDEEISQAVREMLAAREVRDSNGVVRSGDGWFRPAEDVEGVEPTSWNEVREKYELD